ncbi:helix-turn-helix domain-containing protein [Sphingomonas sp. SM33]|uniref:Helix-turn-helix domain-containing protein n=1 Tax=Sphingomonas telluris TaxID=2907998 RepID=A0ABS9VQD0_9SPHN|nr:helix-turn-helix transcriptional regulator [Sphingomonas telluris]MCH8617181.1 helix-turn-helix domain-containing protein [Sphingomonas telluris]
MANGIRKLRKKYGLDQATLAAKLGIAKTELSQFERNWHELPPRLVRDIAVLFECGVADVLGHEIEVEEWRHSPYAAGGGETASITPYGNFGFEIAGTIFSYPISLGMRNGVLRQVRRREVVEIAKDDRSWFSFDTLNNWNVFANPAAMRRLWLKSDDDEVTDYYAHPEVYRAVNRWEYEKEHGPILSQAIADHFELIGEEQAISDTERVRLFGLDGKETSDEYYACERVIGELFGLDIHWFRVEANAFVMVSSSGWYEEEHVNLSHLAVIQVPAEEFCRWSAPDETSPANDDDEAAA